VVTNYAAGITGNKLTATEVVKTMGNSREDIKKVLKEVVAQIPANRTCPCKDALKDAVV
jgi:5'-methylthioadenosine phosphorylase